MTSFSCVPPSAIAGMSGKFGNSGGSGRSETGAGGGGGAAGRGSLGRGAGVKASSSTESDILLEGGDGVCVRAVFGCDDGRQHSSNVGELHVESVLLRRTDIYL